MPELKSPTTYEEQLAILENRNVAVADKEQCKRVLASVNYYRLLAYFLPFKQSDEAYYPGTSFERVYRIYEFDRKLRRALFTAVEEVEVYLRAQFSYFHAHKYGAEGYRNPANFSEKHDSQEFQNKIDREIKSNKNVLFVKHHIEHYDNHFPIWVISELFSFGMLSRFYNDMPTPDKKYLSRTLYDSTPKNVTSWLRCCTDLRNICAHYGRLYFRIFSASPAGFDISESTKRSLWGTLLALRALYPDSQKWNHEFVPTVSALLDEYIDSIQLNHISFPEDWENQLQKSGA